MRKHFVPFVEFDLEMIGDLIDMTLDVVQRLHGQLHRFHACPVVRHGFLLGGVGGHLLVVNGSFVLSDLFCRIYSIVPLGSGWDNCPDGWRFSDRLLMLYSVISSRLFV